ncbi:hypothetical protein Ade02nite_00170 [Paractinoplanes deccanensis]|uniref:Uncharacterized protein n=1 Tax=Paractinoplanes deccanensis TaxID=113561 RepID=A0ABQ3XUF8_9ACTN|nr:hypothetical protein [Actinoplanes deccanensis]GID71376.1 hypothetical protein Ade02nite_00170 [Actinoplanes deccanensis]
MTEPSIPEQRRLFPAATSAEEVPWARQATHHEPATTRTRRYVRDLPSWDPLPPGEILVNRHRRD